jgi:hypothetical protein
MPIKGTYFKLVGFSFCMKLMYFSFYDKKFETKSLREMKLRYTISWWSNKQHYIINQVSSFHLMITPLLHTATALLFYRFFNMVWQFNFSHYKHRLFPLFKYFNVSSDWTATQWPYLVGVTGNICFGATNNASIWPRLCCVGRNTWNINKHIHYKLHSLHIVYKHMQNLIFLYVCFVFNVFSVFLHRFQHTLN